MILFGLLSIGTIVAAFIADYILDRLEEGE